jgi:hypothetical protein
MHCWFILFLTPQITPVTVPGFYSPVAVLVPGTCIEGLHIVKVSISLYYVWLLVPGMNVVILAVVLY